MAWRWRYETAGGEAVTGGGLPREAFPTQADAETWIGEAWRDLLAAGVDQVTLLADDHVEYGPMSLHPAS